LELGFETENEWKKKNYPSSIIFLLLFHFSVENPCAKHDDEEANVYEKWRIFCGR